MRRSSCLACTARARRLAASLLESGRPRHGAALLRRQRVESPWAFRGRGLRRVPTRGARSARRERRRVGGRRPAGCAGGPGRRRTRADRSASSGTGGRGAGRIRGRCRCCRCGCRCCPAPVCDRVPGSVGGGRVALPAWRRGIRRRIPSWPSGSGFTTTGAARPGAGGA